MKRGERIVVALLCVGFLLGVHGPPVVGAAGTVKNVVVLGFDGMDPQLAETWMDAGELPNFARLRASGTFQRLGTAAPPQSPVAWANFITGMNPGGHGIFDFIHRDPETYLPEFSTTKVGEVTRTLDIGRFSIPLESPKIELLRKGVAFWTLLEARGIDATVFRIPSNFPPTPMKGRSLSGMGTQDLQGTAGTFSFYTTRRRSLNSAISGGKVFRVSVRRDVVRSELPGPQNTFLKEPRMATIPFEVYLDPDEDVVLLEVQGKKIVLKEGEWSDWVQLEYELVPYMVSVTGICRFYMKQVRPEFQLYVTPINIDPSNPAMPISTPEDYAVDLYRHHGFFYTQGMAEDTKALQQGIFDDADFARQAQDVFDESMDFLKLEMGRYRGGFLFFYFSSTDLNSHMWWRAMDPASPMHDDEVGARFENEIKHFYKGADEALGLVLDSVPKDTVVIAMSDHGFAPFHRAFHVNNWLWQKGYLALKTERNLSRTSLFRNVDWSRTKLYGVGLNGVYVNLKGREGQGVVDPKDRDALIEQLRGELLAVRDPKTGERVFRRILDTKDIYSGSEAGRGPDVVLGFARGYRLAWESALGQFSRTVFSDNEDKWSGDHLIDPELVPGVLFVNRPLIRRQGNLADLTVTILDLFGVPPAEGMVGTSLLR